MDIQKLIPVCKDYLWGGDKLKEKYGKITSCEPCAESWELSFHPDGKTRLVDEKTLEESVTAKELGENVSGFPFFPVLIKFIDAQNNLSVQVHPDDEYALANEDSFGKTEMWYIVEAAEGAGIYLGFSRDVTLEEYERAIKGNTLTDLLNFYPVKAGDCYFIPSGTIHAIGAGCLICEIQQNSNLTYRVYDYGRLDKNGRVRELHVDKAMRVTDLKKYEPRRLSGNTLGVSKYFNVQKLKVDGITHLSATEKSFQCLTCTQGEGIVNGQKIECGDSFFVPAGFGEYTLDGKMTLILTDVRKYYLEINSSDAFIEGKIVDDEETAVGIAKITANVNSENIVSLCKDLMARANLSPSDITGVNILASNTTEPSLADTVSSALGIAVSGNNI